MLVRTEKGVKDVRAVWWEGASVRAIDQRLLPNRLEILDIRSYEEMADAIANMTVRGAPTIGASGAFGMALAWAAKADLTAAATKLKATRPTAHDLFHSIDMMLRHDDNMVERAQRYSDSIVSRCRQIGDNGADLIRDGARILTHCNAGALATVDYGTALAPMRVAKRTGKDLFVFVDETRPRLQGAKLTAWELSNEGIRHAVIADNAAGHYLKKEVDLVIVGADRIARNGDFANKIGTYEKAVLAEENGVPFYVAAPVSTFDPSLDSGEGIVIEERSAEEVLLLDGVRIAPEASNALNPAFDVTPGRFVSGFITERGILKPSEFDALREAEQ
jgi:S-methyl-5-thioribose-1-phosphate isomerase